jgi:uncharacterized protein
MTNRLVSVTTWALSLALTYTMVGGSTPLGAASFDCSTNLEIDEQAICNNRALSSLDDQMDATYRAAVEAGGTGQSAVRDAQRDFLRKRRSCGSGISCIYRLYQSRLLELRSTLVRATEPVAPRHNPIARRGSIQTLAVIACLHPRVSAIPRVPPICTVKVEPPAGPPRLTSMTFTEAIVGV